MSWLSMLRQHYLPHFFARFPHHIFHTIYTIYPFYTVITGERPLEPLPKLATPLLAPLQSLPEGWSAQSDPATGRTYYYHRITQSTQV